MKLRPKTRAAEGIIEDMRDMSTHAARYGPQLVVATRAFDNAEITLDEALHIALHITEVDIIATNGTGTRHRRYDKA